MLPMRIVLLHAPPWKIPRPGEQFEPAEGPPARAAGPLIQDADFCTIPYGLLSLAAQARQCFVGEAVRPAREADQQVMSVAESFQSERLLLQWVATTHGTDVTCVI